VNKNTLLAFILIMATMAFFLSPTYEKTYRKVTGQKEIPVESQKKAKEIETHPEIKGDTTIAVEPVIKEAAEKLVMDEILPGSDTTKTAPADTIWVETDKIIAGVVETGARIVSLKMKDYRVDHTNAQTKKSKSRDLVELVPKGSKGGCGVTINTKSFDRARFICAGGAYYGQKVRVKANDSLVLAFIFHDSLSGKEMKKTYTFHDSTYKIGLKIKSNDLNGNRLTLSWFAGIHESEQNKIGFYTTEERKVHYAGNKSVSHIKATKLPPTNYENPESGTYRWIGITSKYFFIGVVAETSKDADLKVIAFEDKKKEQKDGKKDNVKRINYSFNFQYTEESDSALFWLYAGPAKYKVLKSYHLEFEQILFPVLSWVHMILWCDYWFPPLAEFVLWLLLSFYALFKDYGIAIVLLTILSKIVTYPLTLSSMKSMNRMRDIQPKINALRNKHKNNPKKMNEEIMALYKTEGVNPLNPGCLPMFLQMPIFISLFIVLQRAIELRGAATVLLPWVKDLSKPEAIFYLPGDGLPLYGANFAILPIIMAILTFFQNKMTIKDPNQKMMIYFMPIFMLVLFNGFPSGLVLYWTMQSALQLVQQFYIDHNKKKEMLPAPVRPTVRKK
jgi:YidC/Oxa1 family membrane protein insertase